MRKEDAINGRTISDRNRSWLATYVWLLAIFWTAVICASVTWNLLKQNQSMQKIALSEARAYFNKDQVFRLWAASHGGVYVASDDRTPPNPYLAHVPERDIETPSGHQLTLMNPAYFVRQMNEEFADIYGVAGHITSLKPLRPKNAPDDWERNALTAFSHGEKEVTEFTDVNGEPHLRLMRPMLTTKSCLKCHAHQGYQVGDVRGGVGVSVPMTRLRAMEQQQAVVVVLGHGGLWLLGLLGIGLGTRQVSQRINERNQAEEELRKAHDRLELRVEQRTAELAATVDKLNMQIDVRKRAEAALNTLTVSLEERVTERTAVAERRAGDLRRLTAELSQAEHRERKRLAKLLHDELQQLLWAVRLRLAKIGRRVEEPLRTELEATIEILNECVATSCDLTVQLNPPILSQGTFREVLEWLGGWFEEKHGLTIAVDAREPIPPVPEHIRVSLFQAVRELLFNAVKHSGETEARVALSSCDGCLTVQVEDAGKDFDARVVQQKLERPSSFGLLSVRERVEFLGGRMEIETTLSGGACFRLMVPLEAAAYPPPDEIQTADDRD
jgi:signal transduction histidine kinase